MDMGMGTTSTSTSSSSSTTEMTMSVMVFHTNLDTPLFSTALTPKTSAQYFGVLVLIMVLGFSFRLLLAAKQQMGLRWLDEQELRKVVVATLENPINSGRSSSRTASSSDGELRERKSTQAEGRAATAENLPIKDRRRMAVAPWRWQVDGVRGILTFVIAGVGYLLMLTVMTMNVGYFFAVLGGILFGELAFGRYIYGAEH